MPDTPSGDPTETLRGARSVIPPQCYARPTGKAVRVIIRSLAVYAAVIALLVVSDALWLLVPLWILAGLALSSLFILAHDAAHGALFANDRANATLGRILMLPHLHVYAGWVVGHNRLHHGHTVRETADFVWHPTKPAEYQALSPLAKLRHRIEWGPLGAGLYYTRVVWWEKMMTTNAPAKHRRSVRVDLALVLAYAIVTTALVVALGTLAGGSLAAGVWMALKVLVIPWMVFMWIIGWAVYVHHIAPDIRWWPRPAWNGFHGQVEGTTILHVPAPLNFFFHNIFVHVPHHVDQRIPYHALPEAGDAIVAAYGETVIEKPLRLRDYLHNNRRCKLYDFDSHRWLPYSASS
ncbi:MAG: fatty acid desaturase [Acidimicrobiia bacterium]|nr:fatty acid desaturase [Acidimicrobiia bacterium]